MTVHSGRRTSSTICEAKLVAVWLAFIVSILLIAIEVLRFGPPGGPGYGPPPGPPGGYNSPSGPLGGYRAPPGPPPMNPGYASGGPSPMPPTHQQSYGSQQGPGQQTQPGYFQSNRRKKALLIGINYIGQEAALQGCIEDVDRMKKFLLSRGYKEEDMVMLKDDSQDRRKRPTRQNIFDAMQWLVKDAGPNDFLFFHCMCNRALPSTKHLIPLEQTQDMVAGVYPPGNQGGEAYPPGGP
ncbi:hypothetical protein PAXINDRAFT_15138 [Paxillus involutus ATCC 200175]|uniref:Peptidase C14 caspase domain-containing protein n=1 Tax=Paxillus involutus ATCC 200175 TaxID=664439 RepID=A0A0C9T8G5_PAXIN|nr:hypothetical protein PAXINDRAFT_15138 [Paxillus involutus ATCC 200175]